MFHENEPDFDGPNDDWALEAVVLGSIVAFSCVFGLIAWMALS